ncbi:MAG: response regulator [Planctomycetota bacterium]|nr:response regulator [Planctomycetota bacterium]
MARILVADDEAPMREMIAMACRMDGHEVTEAFDTPSTISAYAGSTPELLILDLAMPGGGGIGVLKHLRAGHLPMCPVIIVSGYVAEVTGEGRTLIKEHRIIEKPFALETLRAAIREALGPG